MNKTIGSLKFFPVLSYFNGEKVSGPDATLYDYQTAVSNLK